MRGPSSELGPPREGDRRAGAGPLGCAIRHIVDHHHRVFRDQLAALEQLVAPLEREQRALVAKVRRFRREQEAHLLREERVLFPLIEELEQARADGRPPAPRSFGPLRNAIAFMEEDHCFGDRCLARLRALVPPGRAPFDEALARLDAIEADLRLHVAAEEHDLFPAAVLLDEA